MEALGYLWRGEFGIAGRRYSVLERDGKRLFHVHIFVDGQCERCAASGCSATTCARIATRRWRTRPSSARRRRRIRTTPWPTTTTNQRGFSACQERAKAWARVCQALILAFRPQPCHIHGPFMGDPAYDSGIRSEVGESMRRAALLVFAVLIGLGLPPVGGADRRRTRLAPALAPRPRRKPPAEPGRPSGAYGSWRTSRAASCRCRRNTAPT